jgi:hypothetical protein
MHSDCSDVLPGSLLSFWSITQENQDGWNLCLVIAKTLMIHGSDEKKNWEIITIFLPNSSYEKFRKVHLYKSDRNFVWCVLS